jgi:hypothetical protein
LARDCATCWHKFPDATSFTLKTVSLPPSEVLSMNAVATDERRAGIARAIAYWSCTILIGLSFLSGGLADALHVKGVVEGMRQLGYPAHFVTVLGVWKILGAIAILVPGFGLVKEWAYAGMFFDLTGAPVAHLAAGDDVRHVLTPLVLCALLIASWALRPESRRVRRGSATPAAPEAPGPRPPAPPG